ncbi:MAG: ABC transporter permease [Candidatus Dormibacteraeota bacterium]|nr:ABC transporter permease [Candidatus Dormibacteraeota bacterium]
MKRFRAYSRLLTVQLKLFLREPFAVFFTIVFPLVLIFILSSAFGHFQAHPGYRVSDLNVPSLMAFVLANLGLIGIPVVISVYKEHGILKRYRASPITLEALLAVLVSVEFVMFLVSGTLMIVLSSLMFGLHFSDDVLSFAIALLFGAGALFAVGFALGGLISTARTAQAVGMSLLFPMYFLSGAAIPRNEMPHWLARIGDFVPLTYVNDALTNTWIGEGLRAGSTPKALAVMGIFAVGAVLVSWRTFKWA